MIRCGSMPAWEKLWGEHRLFKVQVGKTLAVLLAELSHGIGLDRLARAAQRQKLAPLRGFLLKEMLFNIALQKTLV